MMKAITVNMNTIKITREPGLWNTYDRKIENLLMIFKMQNLDNNRPWFILFFRAYAMDSFNRDTSRILLQFVTDLVVWSSALIDPVFCLSLAWGSLQKRDNCSLNGFQGRLLRRVETAHHLEVPGVYYRREHQRVERLALEWTRLFFKSRTSFKRLSIPLLVESMKVEKKTLIVSSWTFSNSLTKARGTRLLPFTLVLEVFSAADFKRVFAILTCHLHWLGAVALQISWTLFAT